MSTKYQSKFITLAGIFLFFSISLYAADRVHIIKSGETIYGISRFYGVTVDEILFINNMADARSAQVGQHLIIPIVKDLRGTQKPLRVEPLDQRQSVASTAAPVQNTQGVAHTVQKKRNSLRAC
ncbi:MAG: hypothetical protein Ta2G_08520 [Termitinemataceae bacterium]|nr:MAG: hypothetical protein Ta2G_08520 [Termitinemataceae bacterium]